LVWYKQCKRPLTDLERKVLAVAEGEHTAVELAQIAGIPRGKIGAAMLYLKEAFFIESCGCKGNVYKWRRTDRGVTHLQRLEVKAK
jgi:hypothetical protein